jgi:MFS family permease
MIVVRSHSRDLNLLPDGLGELSRLAVTEDATISTDRNWSLAAAVRTRPFWALGIGYLLAYAAQVGVLIHQIRFLTYGSVEDSALPPTVAAFAVSLTSIASRTGRFLVGTVIDRLSRRRVAAAMIAFQSVATLCLLVARGNQLLVLLAAGAFGLVMGSVQMLHSLLVADLFGVHAFGEIYGATLTLGTLGMAAGPWFGGALFACSGSYTIAFTTFAAAGLLGALLVGSAAPPQLVGRRWDGSNGEKASAWR